MPQPPPNIAAESARAPTPANAGRVEGPREETSLLAFFSILLAHRFLIGACALAGMLLFGVFAVSQANLYESQASLIVKGSRPVAQLPGGAAALGLSLAAAADFSQSIVFYADLVRANIILNAVAQKQYRTSDGAMRSLPSIYGMDEMNRRKAVTMAAEKLRGNVWSSIHSRSGIVTFSAKDADPLVAQQLATNILHEMNAFSIDRRQAQAVQERKFIDGLVAEARGKLDQAEETFRRFLELNREYYYSPQLRIENDRLTRDVIQQQQIYTALAQSLEQAKIDEVRDHSALNVVETPDLPTEPLRREALRKTLLGLAAGFFTGIVLAFLRQRARELRKAGTPGFLQFSASLPGRT